MARLAPEPGPSNFYHFGGERAITITADIDKEITTPLIATAAVTEKFDLESDWPGIGSLLAERRRRRQSP